MRRLLLSLPLLSAIGHAEPPLPLPDKLTAIDRPCRASRPDEIIVCRRDPAEEAGRYRLPLPRAEQGSVRPGGEAPTTVADPAGAGRVCGLFAGQRRCGKAEARAYGYGGGADPLTALLKVGRLLLDPDAEVAAPVTLPRGFVPPPR